MREAASRGFWVSTYAPCGYRKAYVQNGAKKRPRLVLNPPADAVVRRMFQMAASGISLLDITRTLNDEGIATPNGKHWLKTSIHRLLANEAYTGTVVWGTNAKDGAPPVRVENAFPGIVTREEFERVAQVLHAKAPPQVHPRRATSPYLLSRLAKCQHCRKSLSAQEAKGGKYTYYVCQSLLKRGRGACDTPRLNAARFERLIIDQIREHILTESNIRDLVRLVDEEMDGVAREERQKLEAIEGELAEVRRRMDRLWFAVETSDMEVNDILPRIRQHQKRQERLERTASEARTALAQRQVLLDRVDVITAYVREMRDFLRTSNTTESRAFIRSFVKAIAVKPGTATIRYTIPTPTDGPIAGRDAVEISLPEDVRNTVAVGTLPLPGHVSNFVRGTRVRIPAPTGGGSLGGPLYLRNGRSRRSGVDGLFPPSISSIQARLRTGKSRKDDEDARSHLA